MTVQTPATHVAHLPQPPHPPRDAATVRAARRIGIIHRGPAFAVATVDRAVGLGPFRPNLVCAYTGCGCRINPFVLVSHAHRVLFFEIPKTGSSSITHLLGVAHDRRDFQATTDFGLAARIAGMYHNSAAPRARRAHAIAAAVRPNLRSRAPFTVTPPFTAGAPSQSGFQRFYGTAEEAVAAYPDYTTVSTWRDPVARVRSCWSMFCHSGKTHREARVAEATGTDPAGMDFETFLRWALTTPNHHWNPQRWFLPYTRRVDLWIDLTDPTPGLQDFLSLIDQQRTELPRLNPSRQVEPDTLTAAGQARLDAILEGRFATPDKTDERGRTI